MLAIFANFVGFAGRALSNSLFIVEPSAMLLLEALDVLVLGHCWGTEMLQQESKHTFDFAANLVRRAL